MAIDNRTEKMIELINETFKLRLLLTRVQLNLEEALHPRGGEPLELVAIALRDITDTLNRLEKENKNYVK